MIRTMAGERDERLLRQLRGVFSDTASNVPEWTRTARSGGYRRDEGLENLLPEHMALPGKMQAVKDAIRRFLEGGGRPGVEVSGGDVGMALDSAKYYHFRVEVEGARLFVKVFVEESRGELDVRVISVKRDDRA